MRARQLFQLRKSHTPSWLCAKRTDSAKSAGCLHWRIQIKLFASLFDHGLPQRLYLLRKQPPFADVQP
jgi:hypothetical protein